MAHLAGPQELDTARPVFAAIPDWAKQAVPGTRGLWAPDIVRAGDGYRLYYSVIDLRQESVGDRAGDHTNAGSAPCPASVGWIRGWSGNRPRKTITTPSIPTSSSMTMAVNGWSFGSFWSGLKMVELDPATGKPLPEDAKLTAIAARSRPGAVEAPFIDPARRLLLSVRLL